MLGGRSEACVVGRGRGMEMNGRQETRFSKKILPIKKAQVYEDSFITNQI